MGIFVENILITLHILKEKIFEYNLGMAEHPFYDVSMIHGAAGYSQ